MAENLDLLAEKQRVEEENVKIAEAMAIIENRVRLSKEKAMAIVNKELEESIKVPESIEEKLEITPEMEELVKKFPLLQQVVERNNELVEAIDSISNSLHYVEYKKAGDLRLNNWLQKIIAGYRNYYFFIQAAKKPFGELMAAIKENPDSVAFSKKYEAQVLKNIFELAMLAKDESIKTSLKKDLEFSEIAVFKANRNIEFMNGIKSGNVDALEVINNLNKNLESKYFEIVEFMTSSSKIDLFPLNLVVIGKKLGIKRLDTLIDGVYVPKPLDEYNFD